ncbi:hypothetical protein FOCC_FOCC007419 [Frankliniella occidentalis]|nr:hypothetical protein FOCC_FOCC007419 [Frankliniella occidentalis]
MPSVSRTDPTMTRHGLLLAALCCCAAALTAHAATSKSSSDELFSDFVEQDGKKYEVADPREDPNQSDSILEDSTAEWQTEMVKGLFNQRKAEKEFLDKLEIGGKTLSAMVNNITKAFTSLETARQQKGSQLIKEHFENEVKQLKKSQAKVLSDLKSFLTPKPNDSAPVKNLFALINGWKNTFRTGLKKAQAHLEEIAESWDML